MIHEVGVQPLHSSQERRHIVHHVRLLAVGGLCDSAACQRRHVATSGAVPSLVPISLPIGTMADVSQQIEELEADIRMLESQVRLSVVVLSALSPGAVCRPQAQPAQGAQLVCICVCMYVWGWSLCSPTQPQTPSCWMPSHGDKTSWRSCVATQVAAAAVAMVPLTAQMVCTRFHEHLGAVLVGR